MCDATVLPHCGHLFNCGACQRFAACRLRDRIFEVLRFGTPICALRKHAFLKKQIAHGDWLKVTVLQRIAIHNDFNL